ncbi:hypothetical protein C2G38_2159471 [Gigaspora rosea]|uniref:Uncharacterized protein n=1 Tax=Gigaspora rosea TaxID=44941 RepID=A0A397W2N8_9GLOM|nr:hypothetical protein C2G38_2159471 [Gigaspora rosea]
MDLVHFPKNYIHEPHTIIQKNQGFIFQEIDEKEESDILLMTEAEFNTFKKKFEKLITKDIIALEKYKQSISLEINIDLPTLISILIIIMEENAYKYSITKIDTKYRRS